MRTITYEMTSHMDGLGIQVLVYEPEGEKKGILQIVHGMAEYKERYEKAMAYFCGHGYVCVIHDHRGHGESIREEGDLGYFYEDGKEAIIEDTHQVSRWIKGQYPELPLYLLGHSMGSLIARCYVKKYDDELAGLIISGCPGNNPLTDLALGLVKAAIKVQGPRKRGNLFQKLAFGAYNNGIEDSDAEYAWVAKNPEVVAKYEKDEKCGFVFTLNGFYNLFLLMKETYSKKGWKCSNPKLPVFFLSGEEDPCMNGRKGFEDAIARMRLYGYANTKGKLYPDMRHEILNEKEQEQVFDDIIYLMER